MSRRGKTLRRSVANRMVAGVCGGLAEYFDQDPTLVRVIYIVCSILTGVIVGSVTYIILWIVIPDRDYV